MGFQVFFHKCSEELQNEVLDLVDKFKENSFELEVKSSGSTGVPKLIIHSKENVIASATRTNTFFKLKEHSKVLCPLAFHTIGAKMSLFRAIAGNYEVHFTDAKRDFTAELEDKTTFDLVSVSVLQLEDLLTTSKQKLSYFKQILVGGSAVPNYLEKLSQDFNLEAYLGFGMTETLSHIALRKLGDDVYTCLPSITVSEVENGMQIHLSKHQTITSTDNIESINNQSFKWIGRYDWVINSAGIKIHPESVEELIQQKFEIISVLVGIPDVTFGEKAVLVTEKKLNTTQIQQISELIENKFGKFWIPKDFIQLQFDYINTLKLNRRKLKERVLSYYE